MSVYNPYRAHQTRVPGPSWKPRVRAYRVTFIFNGQEKFLGVWSALSRENALELCRKELPSCEHFNLIVREDPKV